MSTGVQGPKICKNGKLYREPKGVLEYPKLLKMLKNLLFEKSLAKNLDERHVSTNAEICRHTENIKYLTLLQFCE